MLFNPAILALLFVSAMVSLMVALASVFAIQVLMKWDIQSGSETQLVLERRTYLISVLLVWAFFSELISLLLFIYNAESMSGQFVGAMCATGVLNVNQWGWPTLYLKIAIFFLGAIWLAMNYLDNHGRDYPLIRWKYRLLLLILPLVLAELFVQSQYFLNMNPDVITSCCGSLFSSNAKGVAAEISGVNPRTAMLSLYGTGLLIILSGIWSMRGERRGLLFALMAGVGFVVALVAIVSFIALYIYEHPNHHCPFCILKAGHGFAGYLLYIPLFGGTAFALASGAMVAPWSRVPSLKEQVPVIVQRFTQLSVVLFAAFYLLATWYVLRSNLTMSGVWW